MEPPLVLSAVRPTTLDLSHLMAPEVTRIVHYQPLQWQHRRVAPCQTELRTYATVVSSPIRRLPLPAKPTPSAWSIMEATRQLFPALWTKIPLAEPSLRRYRPAGLVHTP